MTKTPLTEWLSRKGNTQQRLADATGINQTAVSAMLKPRSDGTYRELYVMQKGERLWIEERRVIGDAA